MREHGGGNRAPLSATVYQGRYWWTVTMLMHGGDARRTGTEWAEGSARLLAEWLRSKEGAGWETKAIGPQEKAHRAFTASRVAEGRGTGAPPIRFDDAILVSAPEAAFASHYDGSRALAAAARELGMKSSTGAASPEYKALLVDRVMEASHEAAASKPDATGPAPLALVQSTAPLWGHSARTGGSAPDSEGAIPTAGRASRGGIRTFLLADTEEDCDDALESTLKLFSARKWSGVGAKRAGGTVEVDGTGWALPLILNAGDRPVGALDAMANGLVVDKGAGKAKPSLLFTPEVVGGTQVFGLDLRSGRRQWPDYQKRG